MNNSVININLVHDPKLSDSANSFGVEILIDNNVKDITELSVDQMLHIGAILLNASRKFSDNAEKLLKQ